MQHKGKMQMEREKKRQEFLATVAATVIFGAMVFGFGWLALSQQQPTGHYEPTETMQPDGSYYIWVQDK